MKILIVAEKNDFRDLVELYLSGRYEIKTAENPVEALVVLEGKFFPDLIIIDNVMPFIDGMAIIGIIRRNEIYDNVKLMILCNHNGFEEKSEFLAAGADVCLTKPFRLAKLGWNIENILLEDKKTEISH
ncbi:MAG TPA: response regulator [Bacteroidales bacterium]|nr:response regulator [Bacteroidales bacterium]